MTTQVTVNRAPVLTLWAAVVAERLGHDRAAALTLGKAVAGLNAQSKGRRLGIFAAPAEAENQAKRKAPPPADVVVLLHRHVPVARTRAGLRALEHGKAAEPAAVERYLASKFGDALADVRAAMKKLAGAFAKAELGERAFALYEAFRPGIPSGTRGWGAKGVLDLERLRSLAPAGAARRTRAAANPATATKRATTPARPKSRRRP